MDFVTMKPETLKWIIIGFFMLFTFVSMRFGWLKMSNNRKEKIKYFDYFWFLLVLVYLFLV